MNDERVARRAAAGDRRAFEAIFRRYHRDLYRFCLATVGNPQDAQDALQNTMLKALRALPGEEREIKLKPWLYRVARNESVETLRRRRESTELEPEQPARIPEIAETAAARERLRRLFADLDELPERQRSALTMRELAGLDFDEIGAALGTTGAAARQTLYEARLSLRQMEAGREMDCEAVTRALSDGDGRVARRRDIRAHLRGCVECRAFRDGIAARGDDLRAIAPLPLAASAALLHGVLGGGAAVAGSTVVKSAATVAIVAVVGVTAADRSGLVEVPLPGRDGSDRVERVAVPASAGSASGDPARGAISAAAAKRRAIAERRKGGRIAAASPGGENGRRQGIVGNDPETAERGAGEPSSSREQPAAATRGTPPGPKGKTGEPGRNKPLPTASSQGQQNAAAHKSPRGNPSPGTPRGRGDASPPGSAPAHSRSKPPAASPSKPEKQSPQNVQPKPVPPDKPAPGPFEADEPAAQQPAADNSKEAG